MAATTAFPVQISTKVASSSVRVASSAVDLRRKKARTNTRDRSVDEAVVVGADCSIFTRNLGSTESGERSLLLVSQARPPPRHHRQRLADQAVLTWLGAVVISVNFVILH